AARTRAFTAAYVHAADQLQAVYDAVLAALEKGETLRDFVQRTENILTRPWHRETVFRTNVLSSYGAGHWEQAQQMRALRPYARYSAVMDGRTRPAHARLHGLVLPLNHPFWKTYWPPWDYNCRCAAITLGQGEMESQGLKVSTETAGLPTAAKNFQSPAAGESWQPEYDKYAPELGAALQQRVERAIYD
ncbi:MAG: minor capsid protein, partial [Deltaproteobacteria bacterium]|nr:minor capsid protein [Deltaproteobacteria bacterium]